jgi:UPF0755 protein
MRLKKLFAGVVGAGLVAIAIAGFLIHQSYTVFLQTPLQVTQEETVLSVVPGASMQSIARHLEARGVIDSALYLQLYARLNGLAGRIQTGDYALSSELTPRDLLQRLVQGQVIQYSLTIVEGWSFRQMLAAVHQHDHLQKTLNGLSDEEIMAELGHAGEHPEGRFFPETYYFPGNTSDLEFLQRAYDTMQQQLDEAWQQRAADIPLETPYQALILASIIEKETGQSGERHKIAGVFTRRLQKNMLLQTDPTVIYGLGDDFDGNLRRSHLKTDTPYNTYTRPGLPPTPIALPGAASLLAAVQPEAGQELYFVARGDGTHVFSNTLKEHNRAVRRYQLNR